MKAKLLYRDVAPGADTDAAILTSDAKAFCSPDLLPFGEDMPKIVTLEPDMWLLGGRYKILSGHDIPFLSEAMSDENGDFSSPPKISIEFDGQYTALGLSLNFSLDTGDYSTSVTIEWYQGATLLDTKSFNPTGQAYFCANTVTAFDRIVIYLNSTNKPFRYARVSRVIFGVVREFHADEFSSVKILQEMDLISAELPVNTLEWRLMSRENIEYIFQLKQPVEAYNGESLVGVFYITGSKRKADRIYEVFCEDAVGVLDGYPFYGAIYTDYDAATLLRELIGSEFELEIDASLMGKKVMGLIPPGTRRDALQQVLFAIGAVCSTAGSRKMKIFPLTMSSPLEIPDSRQYAGGSVDTDAIVTAVSVTAHTYTPGSGTQGDEVIEVDGTKYVHTTTAFTVTNPNVTATDKQNVKQVEGATLVNPYNASEVAQRVYDYYMRRSTLNTKLVVKEENTGDYVSVNTPWDTSFEGNITSMSINLSNTTAADVKIQAVGA